MMKGKVVHSRVKKHKKDVWQLGQRTGEFFGGRGQIRKGAAQRLIGPHGCRQEKVRGQLGVTADMRSSPRRLEALGGSVNRRGTRGSLKQPVNLAY